MASLAVRVFRPAMMRGVRHGSVTTDASTFYRDLRKDGMLFLSLCAFGSLATLVGYTVGETSNTFIVKQYYFGNSIP